MSNFTVEKQGRHLLNQLIPANLLVRRQIGTGCRLTGHDEENTGKTYVTFLPKMHKHNRIIRKIRQTPNKGLLQKSPLLSIRVWTGRKD